MPARAGKWRYDWYVLMSKLVFEVILAPSRWAVQMTA
jgi:hypothetical protein